MTKMAAMPIYGKNPSKIFFSESGGPIAQKLALGLNTIIFKHVYWYMQQTQVSVYRTIGPLVLVLSHNIELVHIFRLKE